MTNRVEDDEVDYELLALLRQSLISGSPETSRSATMAQAPSMVNPHNQEIRVLSSAEFIYDNALDVALDARKTKSAARDIYATMRRSRYSTRNWSEHELHPKISHSPSFTPSAAAADSVGDKEQNLTGEEQEDEKKEVVNFIFTMDLLNFCFWSDVEDEGARSAVWYRDKKWTGYWSLVAALRRALDEGKFIVFSFRLLSSLGDITAESTILTPVYSILGERSSLVG